MLSFTLFSFILAAKLSSAVVIDQEGLPETGLNTTDWVAGQLPPLASMWSANDFQIAAKNYLIERRYAGFRTGSLDEITYHANLDQWKDIRLKGWTLRDVSHIDISTTILGYDFQYPFFFSPAANAGNAHPDGELSITRAAGKAGVLYAPSISSSKSIEEIAAARLENQTMFHQEYTWSNTTRVADEIRRIEETGHKALFLTLDNPGVNGVRTRSLRLTGPTTESGHSMTFDVNALIAFRNLTTLPVVPKGIKTWQEAKICADLGFPAIYISNHGGRLLDGAPTATEVLLDIHNNAPEVFDQVEVYADGGIRRGSDILKLLALGVRAVGLGRPHMFANIYGEEGVTRLIALLNDEIKTTMGFIGVNTPADLNRDYLNTKLLENKWF